MGAGASAAIAIIIKQEKDLAAHFRAQRATSVSTARSLEELRVEHNRIFRRLEDRAIIRQGPGGTYYLDELSWNAMNSGRRRVLMVVLLIGILLTSFVLYTAKTRMDVPEARVPTNN